MGLNFSRPLFEDGNVNSYNKQTWLMTGALTKTITGFMTESGQLTGIYDYDNTTYYTFATVGGEGTFTLVWDFKQKTKFKTLYFDVKVTCSVGGGTCKAWGSNNNTDWTQIGSTVSGTAAGAAKTITGTDQNYRYIKLEGQRASAGAEVTILVYSCLGVI